MSDKPATAGLGDLIRRYRLLRGLEQAQLGRLLHPPLSASSISLIEREHRPPTLAQVRELQRALAIPLEELVKALGFDDP